MKLKMQLSTMGLVLVTLASLAPSQSKRVPQTDGAQTLLKLDADFQEAVKAHGWDGYVSFLSDDATELENGDPIHSGKENIRQWLGPYSPDTSLTWTPVKAEMASCGDFGYTFGLYTFRSKNADGKMTTTYGKYTTIWKKQKDGIWKVVLDMGDLAPAPKD
jgi:ketosteroid isomerase-like protein